MPIFIFFFPSSWQHGPCELFFFLLSSDPPPSPPFSSLLVISRALPLPSPLLLRSRAWGEEKRGCNDETPSAPPLQLRRDLRGRRSAESQFREEKEVKAETDE